MRSIKVGRLLWTHFLWEKLIKITAGNFFGAIKSSEMGMTAGLKNESGMPDFFPMKNVIGEKIFERDRVLFLRLARDLPRAEGLFVVFDGRYGIISVYAHKGYQEEVR